MRPLLLALMCASLFGEGAFSDLSLEQALVEAAKSRRIVLIDFYTTWCGPCKLLDSTTWKDEQVVALLRKSAISIKVDAEKDVSLSKKYSITGYPTLLLLRPDGSVLDRMVGYQKPEAFLASFQGALRGLTSLDRAREAVSTSAKGGVRDQVSARYQLARVLTQEGHHEEALKEYLWLYDDGMKSAPGFMGVRNSYLLSDIQKLGLTFPPALAALRQHRDRAKDLFLAAPDDRAAAQDLTSLNHALKDEQSSFATFDQLPADSPGRKTLGSDLWNELIKRKRYADALNAKSPTDMLDQISREERFQPPDPALRTFLRANLLEFIASGVEALAGTERMDEARLLVKKALDIDSSPATKALLERHLRRSGNQARLESLQ